MFFSNSIEHMINIVTNIQLCDLEIVESNKCVFCSNHPETLLHLFSECSNYCR